MMNVSQSNLLQLAQQNEAAGHLSLAIQNLEEALQNGHSLTIVLALSRMLRENKQASQAYALLKEERDLFSDPAVFAEYSRVLRANHFLIEALQIKHVANKEPTVQVQAVSLEEQQRIMSSFGREKQVTQAEYQKLLKLNLINFKAFAQSLLLNPSLNFAVRLALCEDLIRLGVSQKISVWVLGQKRQFIPNDCLLLEQEPLYREVISALGSRLQHNPSQLPLVLGEANLVLGSLYPKIKELVDEPDSFASDLISYLEKKKGNSHQELLDQVYRNLPNN